LKSGIRSAIATVPWSSSPSSRVDVLDDHAATPPASAIRGTVSGADSRSVGPLRDHLDLAAEEERIVHRESVLHPFRVGELYVGKPE